ncbi:MAG: NAD(P)-dependent oxidoreductase [Pseudomonadota bacterium]
MRIGFIGIGKMGAPMALCLARAGHEVVAFDTSVEALGTMAESGVIAAPDPASAVSGAEAVITMLPNGQIVGAVVAEIADVIPAGAVLIDMSTSYPLETLTLRKALPDVVDLIDAPVSGGVWRAELGQLTIIAGGAGLVLDRVEPMLSSMGTVTRTGALGSGHAMKLLNNYLSASGLAAACEAVLIGRRFGLDPDVMADVFNASTGMNNATKVKLRQHINNKAFASGFTMGLMSKDLTMARRLAGDMEIPAEGLAATQALFAQAVDALGDMADHTEVIKLLTPDG